MVSIRIPCRSARTPPDSDRGLVLQASDASDWFDLDVGDELTFRYNTDEEVTLTIAGIIANPVDAIPLQLNIAGAISAAIVSDNAVPDGVEPETSALIVDAEPDRVDDTVIAISEIPGVFVFETSLINSFITAIVDQRRRCRWSSPYWPCSPAAYHRQYRLAGDIWSAAAKSGMKRSACAPTRC